MRRIENKSEQLEQTAVRQWGCRTGRLEVSNVEEQKYKNHEGIDRDRHDICSPIPPFFIGFIAHNLLRPRSTPRGASGPLGQWTVMQVCSPSLKLQTNVGIGVLPYLPPP